MSRPTREELYEVTDACGLGVAGLVYDALETAERDLAETRRMLALAEAVIEAVDAVDPLLTEYRDDRGREESLCIGCNADLNRREEHRPACSVVAYERAKAAWDRRNETSGRSTLGEVEQTSGSALPPESAGERAIGHDPLADRVPGESANLATLRAVAAAARTAAEQVGGPAAAGLLRLAEALETPPGRADPPDAH